MSDTELKVQKIHLHSTPILVGETWEWKVNLTHNGRFAVDMQVFMKSKLFNCVPKIIIVSIKQVFFFFW